ncbi:MAG: fibronectin type III domain-containing protein, partial [Dehalococcoidia bacterium]|nr:fibronectin type III domain-containing protein [Dehalococcoidia bacterium]
MFTKDSDGWSEKFKVTASDGAADHYLGRSVALDGDTLVAAAPNADGIAVESGSAYVFEIGGNWTDISGSGDETTSHTIANLLNRTAYTYRVRAVNASGEGPVSEGTAVTSKCYNGTAVPNQANELGLVKDCIALLAMKSDLPRDGWLNWSASRDIRDWNRITVEDSQDRVVFLNLYSMGLRGPIPAAVYELDRLRGLHLHKNELTGPISKRIGDFTDMMDIYLSQNQLTGSIPEEIGDLNHIQQLHLSQNQLTGSIPEEIGDLTKLRGLTLHANELSGSIPTEIGNLTKLGQLNLSSNELSGSIPTEIGNLTSLRGLTLGGNELSGSIPVEIGNLTKLENLVLSGNGLSGGIPAEIGNLPKLKYLWLGWNDLSGSIPSEIGDLTKLRTLDLSSAGLSGEIPVELGNLDELEGLYLSDNDLVGPVPAVIGTLDELERLYLDGNSLAGGLPRAQGSLPSLEETRIDYVEGNTYPLVRMPSDVSWTLVNRDADQFSIDSSGRLTFNSAPDFDNPTDANENKVYEVCIADSSVTTSDCWYWTSGLKLEVTVTASTAEEVPAAPSDFVAATTARAQFTLSWGGQTASTLRYQLSVNDEDFSDISGSSGGTTETTLTGLNYGQEYKFEVRAVNAIGTGAESTVSATMGLLAGSVLVSSMEQHGYFASTNDVRVTQGFKTGKNGHGYLLKGIDLNVYTAPGEGTLTVKIRRANSSGDPGDDLYTLTNPDSLATGVRYFAAPE